MDPYFYLLSLAKKWKHSRKYFKPEELNAWNYNIRAIPINSHEPLIIPIHCTHNNEPTNNHFIMAARFKNEDTQADWDLVLVDSLNDHGTLCTAKNRLRNGTTLLQKEGHMDTLTPNTTLEDTRTLTATCVKQKEVECSFRMLLHILLAGTSKTARECITKLNKLKTVENLPRRCRHWTHSILTDIRNDRVHPRWIMDLQTACEQTNTEEQADN